MGVVVIMGASPDPSRFSYRAVRMLMDHGYDCVPLGIKNGNIGNLPIQPIKDKPKIGEVDTITLYMNPVNQTAYLNYMIGLNPRRIIFNPGTDNPILRQMAAESGIEVVEDCTLIMLGNGTF